MAMSILAAADASQNFSNLNFNEKRYGDTTNWWGTIDGKNINLYKRGDRLWGNQRNTRIDCTTLSTGYLSCKKERGKK